MVSEVKAKRLQGPGPGGEIWLDSIIVGLYFPGGGNIPLKEDEGLVRWMRIESHAGNPIEG